MDDNEDSNSADGLDDVDWMTEGTHCYINYGSIPKETETLRKVVAPEFDKQNITLGKTVTQETYTSIKNNTQTVSITGFQNNDVHQSINSNDNAIEVADLISPFVATNDAQQENLAAQKQLVQIAQTPKTSAFLPSAVVKLSSHDVPENSAVHVDVSDDQIFSDKYSLIPQRIIRKQNCGIQQVIRILVPRDFLKTQGRSSIIFTCPRCPVLSKDLSSLSNHMISCHDLHNTEVNTFTENSSCNLNESHNSCAEFACSLCNRSFDLSEEWQFHFYMHLTNSVKRVKLKKINKKQEKPAGKFITVIKQPNDKSNSSPTEANETLPSENNDTVAAEKTDAAVVKRGRGRPRLNGELLHSSNTSSIKQKSLQCRLCKQFVYQKQGELKRHMLSEHGDQLHRCKYCEMAFPLGHELLRHIRLYHPNQPVKKNPPIPKKSLTCLRIRFTDKKTGPVIVQSDPENEDIPDFRSKNAKVTKLIKSISRKLETKKRRISSDSDSNETDSNVTASRIKSTSLSLAKNDLCVLEGGPSDGLRSRQRKNSKPVKKPQNVSMERIGKVDKVIPLKKRKGVSVRRPVIIDDDDLLLDEADACEDHDWENSPLTEKRKGIRRSISACEDVGDSLVNSNKDMEPGTAVNPEKNNPKKPTRKRAVRVPLDEIKRKSVRRREVSDEPKERKSGSLFLCDHCGCCYEKRKELIVHIVSDHEDKLLKCTGCPKSFALFKSLKVHLMACHSQEMFNCRRCDQKFVTLSRLQRHVRIDHLGHPIKVVKKKPYGCSFCGKLFQTKQILDGHTNQHHLNVRPYKCSKCGIDFAYINNFKMHERTCLKSMICELCGQNFATKGVLAEHQKAVHDIVLDTTIDVNKPDFVCDHCNKEFPSELSLKCHLARVSSAAQRASVLCDICGKECKKAAGLTMHKAYCHPQEAQQAAQALLNGGDIAGAPADISDLPAAATQSSPVLSASPSSMPVTCTDCGKICRTSTSLRIHRTRMHSNGGVRRTARSVDHCDVDICCPTCGQTCKGKVGLTAHLRSHAPATPLEAKCDKCDRTFDNKLGLDMHKRHAHTDTRKYRQVVPCSCPICSKEFTREGPMKLHMAVVHGLSTAKKKAHPDKVFVCNICGHQFKMKAYLQRHNRMHAGVKPYICSVCSKCFTSSTNLAGHMAALHKDVEYTYNPLVNMVCNVGDVSVLQQASQGQPMDRQQVAPRKAPNPSRKSSSRKNAAARDNSVHMVVHDSMNMEVREDPSYSQDILKMSREIHMAHEMSGMVREMPSMSRDMAPLMPREIPVMTRELPGMSRGDIQNMVSSREMPIMPREIPNMQRDIMMQRENPNVPQYTIGSMPTNWNYAYMGEFYRL